MKVVIAGSRSAQIIQVFDLINLIRDSQYNIAEVVSGGAIGADAIGEYWARMNNVPIRVFKADWKRYNKAAGPIRNSEMAEYCDAALFLWDGKSSGTRDMIRKVSALNKPHKVAIFGETNNEH